MKKIFKILSIFFLFTFIFVACKSKVNGTYEGKARGHNGEVVIDVKFENSKINNIVVKENVETEDVGLIAINRLKDKVLKGEKDLDIVTGATYSSEAFINSLSDAINKAGLNKDDFIKTNHKFVERNEVKEINTDVVVVGSGGSGMISAIKAKESGANVVILEKLPIIGGNTLISGAEYAAPNNWLQEKENIKDSVEIFQKDVEKAGGDKELISVLAQNALDGAKWLRDDIKVEWENELMFFGGHSVKRALIPKGQSGKELVNKLSKKLEDLGVEIITEANAYELIFENETVKGVKAKIKTGELIVNAKSVVLATGGFGANKKMLFENDKEIDDKILSTNSVGSMGDGIKMARAIGADVVDLDKIQLYPVCDVQTGKLLYTGDTRLTSGAILINQNGKRFVEELDTRRVISMAIKSQEGSVAYQLWDENSTKKSKILDHHSLEAKNLLENKKMIKANSLDEVADFFGIDKENLKQTVEKFNEDSKSGKDTEFNLRRLGFTIDTPPYYAIKAVPAVHHTMGGLKINKETNVLDKNGNIIRGLFASGEVTGGIHGNNRLGSVSIADITVFGIIAGTNAAKNK
ncbi:MAG: flavocytochrome c [Peptoniphilaceae bacterium]|uniref:flavocytochrome c n=1 Tax=Parvimonas sp. TaxID=1944660 RepID=UPI0025EBFB58|nr:flavocytochrome c [Parvimonas sp.]MCI5998059.1 flavocytochrome c [Parvimonas sp.]MDD7764994.1 flavocytochrome c [Peptoniphilaceae bacterium]MDY3050322.1 flavocytochrome c [Parvimonas sp.]